MSVLAELPIMCKPSHPVEHLLDGEASAQAHLVVEIDPHGDLTLVVGSGDDEPIMRFLVCSRALARASKAFDAMLYGPFKESKPHDSSAPWVVSLPADDPKTIEAVLHIIHLNVDKIPKCVGQHALFKILVLGDKYMMRLSLKQNVCRWYKKLRSEYLIYDDTLRNREHLSVGRWMGDSDVIWRGLFHFANNCRLEDNTLVYEILPKNNEDGSSENEGSDMKDIYSSPLSVELEHLPKMYIGEFKKSVSRLVIFIPANKIPHKRLSASSVTT